MRFPRLVVGGLAAVAILGTVLFAVDSSGYWRALQTDAAQRFWLIGWPLVAVAANVALLVVRRRSADRPTSTPSAFIALAALIIAAIAGYDRIDVVNNSQLQSSNPDWLTRASAVTCLALGATLLVRFLADLIPRAIGGPRSATLAPPVGGSDAADV